AAARYCSRENKRVTLTGMPENIASSIAGRPSLVPGILIRRLGRAARANRSLAAESVLAVSCASVGDTSNDTHPSTPFVSSKMGRKRSAARVRSSRASSKKTSSLDSCFANFLTIVASYAVLFLIAWSKMVGFEVSPVTDRSLMYCFSVPLSSRSRVMLSSQRLWPRLWRICVAFIVLPQLFPKRLHRYPVHWLGANDWYRSKV